MSDFKEKINRFFLLGDEKSSEENEKNDKIMAKERKNNKIREKEAKNHYQKENQQLKKHRGENIVAINQKTRTEKPRISIVEPRLYSEVHSLSDILLKNQSVIINFRRMDQKEAKKMLDFLMGVIYAIHGDIQRLGEEIFICTPKNVEVDGSELSEFAETLL